MSPETEEVDDRGGTGAEGGDDENAETLPFAPGEGDDTPLGDTDQHSEVTETEHDRMRGG
jgi:hypothetical protein